jgi:hypothetical protein
MVLMRGLAAPCSQIGSRPEQLAAARRRRRLYSLARGKRPIVGRTPSRSDWPAFTKRIDCGPILWHLPAATSHGKTPVWSPIVVGLIQSTEWPSWAMATLRSWRCLSIGRLSRVPTQVSAESGSSGPIRYGLANSGAYRPAIRCVMLYSNNSDRPDIRRLRPSWPRRRRQRY